MKIVYNENPLQTVIELDDNEKKLFWHKIKIKQLVELLFSAHFGLTYKSSFKNDKERIKYAEQAVEPGYYSSKWEEGTGSKRAKMDDRVDEMYQWYLETLSGPHCGDCNCVPVTCPKCLAEDILEIDTIPGLGKHEAAKIDAAFRKGKSINEVLKYLKSWELDKEKHKGYEFHFERWRQETINAYNWLKKYKEEHFSG